MSRPESSKLAVSGQEIQRDSKKPYQKPAMRFEPVFETRALTCGKVQSTQSQCAHHRMNS